MNEWMHEWLDYWFVVPSLEDAEWIDEWLIGLLVCFP